MFPEPPTGLQAQCRSAQCPASRNGSVIWLNRWPYPPVLAHRDTASPLTYHPTAWSRVHSARLPAPGRPHVLQQVLHSARDRLPSQQAAAPTESREASRFGLRSRRPTTISCCGRSVLVSAYPGYPAPPPRYPCPTNRPRSNTLISFRPKSKPSSSLRQFRSHPTDPTAYSRWGWYPNHGRRSSGLSST